MRPSAPVIYRHLCWCHMRMDFPSFSYCIIFHQKMSNPLDCYTTTWEQLSVVYVTVAVVLKLLPVASHTLKMVGFHSNCGHW